MSDSLFDDDDDDGPQVPNNVLAVGPVAETPEALTAYGMIVRDDDYRDACRVIFEDEEGQFANADEFKRAMRLGRLPTIAEAGEWLAAKRDAVERRAAS